MNATEYGAHLATLADPLTDEQVETAARLFAAEPDAVAA